MLSFPASRPPNLLDQRFAPAQPPRHVPDRADAFELKCSLMLAMNDVYLSDLAPDTLSQVCERLRARLMQLMPPL